MLTPLKYLNIFSLSCREFHRISDLYTSLSDPGEFGYSSFAFQGVLLCIYIPKDNLGTPCELALYITNPLLLCGTTVKNTE